MLHVVCDATSGVAAGKWEEDQIELLDPIVNTIGAGSQGQYNMHGYVICVEEGWGAELRMLIGERLLDNENLN